LGFTSSCSAIGVVRQSELGCVTVELEPPARCEGCAGACLWYRSSPCEPLTLETRGAIPVGATVVVTLPERYLLAGATVVYAVPLAALLGGAATGAAIFGGDWAAAAGGAAALLLTVLAASPLRRRLERATLRRLSVQPLA
jgi:positive regulator of sigma E activity